MVSGGTAGTEAGRAGGKGGIERNRYYLQDYITSIMTNGLIGDIVVTVENKEDG